MYSRHPDLRPVSILTYCTANCVIGLCLFKLHHIQTVHLLPDLTINSDEILSIEVYRIDNEERREIGKQAVVTDALFNVKL